jgi:hypothetical protein
MKPFLSFIFIALWITPILRASQDLIVSPDIESVVSGGYWQSDKQEGRYRVIVVNQGSEHVYSIVYLQWVTNEEGDAAISFSIPISEINDSPVWSVGVPEFLNESRQIRLNGINSYTQEKKSFILTPHAVGKYLLREGK